jgi:hypothetical protein
MMELSNNPSNVSTSKTPQIPVLNSLLLPIGRTASS